MTLGSQAPDSSWPSVQTAEKDQGSCSEGRIKPGELRTAKGVAVCQQVRRMRQRQEPRAEETPHTHTPAVPKSVGEKKH